MITLAPVDAGLARRPARGLTRKFVAEAWTLSRWLWAIAALIAVTGATVAVQFTPITVSIWENSSHWSRWFLFIVGIVITIGYFPLVVAHGITRRTVLKALGATGLAVSALWAGLTTLGMVIERVAYSWLGWTYRLQAPHLFDGGYDVGGMFVEYGLLFVCYLGTGSLIAAAYYRYGGWRGSFLLPLTMLPLVGIEAVLSTGWVGTIEEALADGGPAAPIGIAVALVVILLSGLGNYLMLRDVAIHSKTS